MRCLVTGALGFLGSHMVNRLLAEGHTVTTLDADPRADMMIDIRYYTLDHLYPLPPVEWVFHFAGLAAIPPSMTDPANYIDVNAQGTANMLEQRGAPGPHASSMPPPAPATATGPPMPTPEQADIDCTTPYALSKWMGEELVRHWDRVFDLPSVSLRLFSVPMAPAWG